MLSFFPRDVLDEILDLMESVSEGFPSYSYVSQYIKFFNLYKELSWNAFCGFFQYWLMDEHVEYNI